MIYLYSWIKIVALENIFYINIIDLISDLIKTQSFNNTNHKRIRFKLFIGIGLCEI
jgi:hypothetical protein